METYRLDTREWNNRRLMSDTELHTHKKALVKKWSRKAYIKQKCNNRIFELEELIADTYDDLDCETLTALFEELDILIEQRNDIVNNKCL